MKMNFAYNLLKQLRSKKDEGGFTLIELLVVIIIIGILAAIALPSFLNQANRARETEATNAIGSLNRGQQAFYLENVEYTDTAADLDVGTVENTENYGYGSQTVAQTDAGVGDSTFLVGQNAAGDDNQIAVIYATPRANLRGFAGISYVETVVQGAGADATTKSVTSGLICREVGADVEAAGIANAPGAAYPGGADPTAEDFCGGMQPVN
ncbi:type IV pilin-like G/H family protein [Halomicronema sp. CCY15110]|uniref:type IV pilin-like G/H family protein n=1 Tax=Halomicronema sp. CCY15110 TaxID=2767773 RepID=UPI00272EE405|nr:type IV pilin-like G/H family protein [Halomicronema sp. CCY15110]